MFNLNKLHKKERVTVIGDGSISYGRGHRINRNHNIVKDKIVVNKCNNNFNFSVLIDILSIYELNVRTNDKIFSYKINKESLIIDFHYKDTLLNKKIINEMKSYISKYTNTFKNNVIKNL